MHFKTADQDRPPSSSPGSDQLSHSIYSNQNEPCVLFVFVFDLPVQTKIHSSSALRRAAEVTEATLWTNDTPLSTVLFLHGWLFRLKCHCLCSFSLMLLLNFAHLTCSVRGMWISLTGFTRPCASTRTCDCSLTLPTCNTVHTVTVSTVVLAVPCKRKFYDATRWKKTHIRGICVLRNISH